MVLVWNNQVLEQNDEGFVWGKNLANAAEFDTHDQMSTWIPEDLFSGKRISFVALPDRLDHQKNLAVQNKLFYVSDIEQDKYGDLKLPSNYISKYFTTTEVAAFLGIATRTVRDYHKFCGDPIYKKQEPTLNNPKASGPPMYCYTTEQVDMIFQTRLKSPRINTARVAARYEAWLITVER